MFDFFVFIYIYRARGPRAACGEPAADGGRTALRVSGGLRAAGGGQARGEQHRAGDEQAATGQFYNALYRATTGQYNALCRALFNTNIG